MQVQQSLFFNCCAAVSSVSALNVVSQHSLSNVWRLSLLLGFCLTFESIGQYYLLSITLSVSFHFSPLLAISWCMGSLVLERLQSPTTVSGSSASETRAWDRLSSGNQPISVDFARIQPIGSRVGWKRREVVRELRGWSSPGSCIRACVLGRGAHPFICVDDKAGPLSLDRKLEDKHCWAGLSWGRFACSRLGCSLLDSCLCLDFQLFQHAPQRNVSAPKLTWDTVLQAQSLLSQSEISVIGAGGHQRPDLGEQIKHHLSVCFFNQTEKKQLHSANSQLLYQLNQ